MQVLPPDFNDFLWNGDFDYLFLSNDNGQIVKTAIHYQVGDSLTSKLTKGLGGILHNQPISGWRCAAFQVL
jgi:hypothetical protein